MTDDIHKIIKQLRESAERSVGCYTPDTFGVPLSERSESKAADMLEQQQARIEELEKELDDWKAQGFDFSPDEY